MVRLNDEFHCPTNFSGQSLGRDLLDFVATGALMYQRCQDTMSFDDEFPPWSDPQCLQTTIFERITSLHLRSDLDEEIDDAWLWLNRDVMVRVIGNPSPYYMDGTLSVPASWSSEPSQPWFDEESHDIPVNAIYRRYRNIF